MNLKSLTDGVPGIVVAAVGAAIIGGGAVIGGGIIAGLLDPGQPAAQVVLEAPKAENDTQPEVPEQAEQASEQIAPEAPSGSVPLGDADEAIEAEDYMVVAAHPAAAQAGAAMLEQGGSAIDAAIATQMVLNLVEPQSSGIGGGGFMLHWNAAKRRLDTYDGRETAPLEIEADSFLKPDGEPKSFIDALTGGKSVGVPGLLRMLEMAHQQHGKLPWATLFEPAIALAESGFPISPRLLTLLSVSKGLTDMPATRAYFYAEDGSPKPVGAILKNPEFASSLRMIAQEGPDAFYDGALTAGIVAAVQNAPRNPGLLTRRDMVNYQAVHRRNLCARYRDHLVCGMPPPSSGGLALLQGLKVLDAYELDEDEPLSADTIALVSEASALAFADRNAYVADPDFVRVPVSGMMDVAYLRDRAELVDLSTAAKEKKQPGEPRGFQNMQMDNSVELPSTTHMSIIDEDGNAVSMTTSIETGFGSRLMVHGFLLNNQLTDFAWIGERDGKPVANRIQGGKRPRSSMSPAIVFDEDRELKLITGSPGGSRIIGYTQQSIINNIDFDMDPQEAVSAPHFINRNGPIDLEEGTGLEALTPALEARGYTVRIRPLTSGLHMIEVDDGEFEGGADPRREGAVIGEEQFRPEISDAFNFIEE